MCVPSRLLLQERNLAIRSNRGSAPVSMAQKPVPGPGLLPPGTAHYSLHAEIPGKKTA